MAGIWTGRLAFLFVLSTVLVACIGEQTSTWVGPSGRSYEIVQQGSMWDSSGQKALTLKYRVGELEDHQALQLAADELAMAMQGQAEKGDYDAMVIMAEKVNFSLGPFYVKQSANILYKRRPDGSWTAVHD